MPFFCPFKRRGREAFPEVSMIEIGEIAFDAVRGEISAEVRVTEIGRERAWGHLFPLEDPVRRVWYRVERRYAKYLTWERSDGFVVHHLMRAFTEGHDITFRTPISLELHEGLTEIVIPLICRHVPDAHPVRLLGPVAEGALPSEGGTATFCSGGVDSFYSIFKHRTRPAQRRLTHLLCFDVGAFGDTSRPEGVSERDGTFEVARAIAKDPEIDLPLVTVESNLTHGAFVGHLMGMGFANIGGALLLQKLVAWLYCPGAGDRNPHTPDVSLLNGSDVTLWAGAACSTANLRILHDDLCPRLEKLRALAEFAPARRYLLVGNVVKDGRNSGTTSKSVRTLLLLEACGRTVVEAFASRFDMEAFRANRRSLLREQLRLHLAGHNDYWSDLRRIVLPELSVMDHFRLAKWYFRAFFRKIGWRKRKRFASVYG